jgi:hypothetical protein
MTVERVHDDRWSRSSREHGSRPTDSAGLRRMRVEDVRPHVLDERGQPVGRAQVVERRDLAMEIGQLDDVDASLLRDIRHRALAARERAGDQRRLVAALLEPRREIRHVERRPTLVEPRYDA